MIDAPDDKDIGKNIAEIRKRQGLTQLELSEKLGITRTLLSNYEIGRNRIHAGMLYKLAVNLKVSTDTLLLLEKDDSSTNNVSLRLSKRIKKLEKLPEHRIKSLLRTLDDIIEANKS